MNMEKNAKRFSDVELADLLDKPKDFIASIDAQVFTKTGYETISSLPPYESALFFSIAMVLLNKDAPKKFKQETQHLLECALNAINVTFFESNSNSGSDLYKSWMKTLYKSHLIIIKPRSLS